MEFICAEEKQWKEIKTIYMEAFPKRERKPYFALRHSVKTKKAVVMAATEGEQVLGFIVLIPYKDMVMADYLAVSSKVRSRGTGSYIMQNVCRQYKDKKIVLLIERLDDKAENKEQKNAKKKSPLEKVLGTIMGGMGPTLHLLCACGIIKGLLVLLTFVGVKPTDGIYMLMNAAGDCFFYFLPHLLFFQRRSFIF